MSQNTRTVTTILTQRASPNVPEYAHCHHNFDTTCVTKRPGIRALSPQFWNNVRHQTSQNTRTVTTIPDCSCIVPFIGLPYRNFELLKLRSVETVFCWLLTPFRFICNTAWCHIRLSLFLKLSPPWKREEVLRKLFWGEGQHVFFRNVGKFLQDYSALHLRRYHSLHNHHQLHGLDSTGSSLPTSSNPTGSSLVQIAKGWLLLIKWPQTHFQGHVYLYFT